MRREVELRYRLRRGGADYAFLRAPDDDAPQLRMDAGAEIKAALTGTFLPWAWDAAGRRVAVNWLTDAICPELVIDGAAHPLGVYLPAAVTEQEDDGRSSVRVQAYDRCWLVRDTVIPGRYYIPAGAGYIQTVKQLLALCGMGLVFATANASTFPEAREDWDAGTSVLDIVNQLLGEINYKQLWFNAAGWPVLEPAATPTAEHIQHTLDAADVKSLILPKLRRDSDWYSAPNVFVCICDNPDKSGPMVATAENNNPQSPLSITRRGRRIMDVEYLDNVASQAELEAYAARKRNRSLITGETVELTTGLLPGYGVEDVVGLHYGDLNALCVDRSWVMELRPGGSMVHRLERIVYALG